MNSRQKQAKETREHILKTAQQLFEQYDSANVSVDQICQAAGISKGGFYHHFTSKNQVIITITGNTLDQELGQTFSSLLGKISTYELLKKYVEILIDYHEHMNPHIISDFWQYLVTNEHDEELIQNRFALTIMKDIAKQGLEKGDFSNTYTEEFCSNYLTASITGLFIHWDAYHNTYELRSFIMAAVERLYCSLQ